MHTSPANTTSHEIVHLFVFDAMADWEAGLALAAINSAQFRSAPGYRVVTVAPSLAAVTTMNGVRVQPDVSLDTVTPDASAMLILPGGRTWETGANAEALRLASRFVTAGVPVAAMCAATVALARAGFLDRLRQAGDAREFLISSGDRGTAFYCGVPSSISTPAAPANRATRCSSIPTPRNVTSWRNTPETDPYRQQTEIKPWT
jgi:putative intracellular protease/amidase